MRALDSRKPGTTSSFPRVRSSCLLLLLVFHALGDGQARNVPVPGDPVELNKSQENVAGDPVEFNKSQENAPGELGQVSIPAQAAKVHAEEVQHGAQLDAVQGIKVETIVHDETEGLVEVAEAVSVPKKRRRNDVALPGKLDRNDADLEEVDGEGQVSGEEGIRRFDAQVESEDESEQSGRRKVDVVDPAVHTDLNVAVDAEDEQQAHQKRLIDAAGVKSKEVKKDEQVAEDSKTPEKMEVEGRENVEETIRYGEAGSINAEIRNDLRSLESNEKRQGNSDREETSGQESVIVEEAKVKEFPSIRQDRQLSETRNKSKYKTSTVYLNAEEKAIAGEQESIVDDQIKKVISIRDDVLDSSVGINSKNPLPMAVPEKTVLVQESSSGLRSERLEDTPVVSRIDRWKEQALRLQEQIKNRTFLQHLMEQTTEVLPEAPKFDEHQLLEALRSVISSKKLDNESYLDSLNGSSLNANQLEILRCAEQLVESKQRQSFAQNMADCIRGLSVLNCMRIFVWPILVENIPAAIQNSANLPIEVNLMDLFQGNRGKSGRSSEPGGHRQQLLTPYIMVAGILTDVLQKLPEAEAGPTYFDLRNETVRKLLSSSQLEILQMAEKILPAGARREYADRMFSCVRRFEYFSCIKYFAWPMVKQYYPGLPSFPLPDYAALYPSIPLAPGYPQYPQYPILPFPGFSEEAGQLPEVVDVDGTRKKENPRPETMIIHILRNTLKEHAATPVTPSFLDSNKDAFLTVIPEEQLAAVHMAEQFLPAPYRPEFVQKTIRCIQEFNYLSCIKYSTWPTIREFAPRLPQFPDLGSWIPEFQIPELPDFFGGLPQIPTIQDISSFFSGTLPTEVPVVQVSEPESVAVLVTRSNGTLEDSNNTESRIMGILRKVRDSLKGTTEGPSLIVGGNVVVLTTITEDQVNILKLAESILPPAARATLITQVLACLQEKNEFVDCTRCIVWPSIATYAPELPEFPVSEALKQSPQATDPASCLKKSPIIPAEGNQQGIISEVFREPNVQISSRNPFQAGSSPGNRLQEGILPVISVTGTRFVPILNERPEVVILSILRTIQRSIPSRGDGSEGLQISQNPNLLNDVQREIIRITENLLPEGVRLNIVNQLMDCVAQNDFIICTRDIIWPTMLNYYPGLPSFPNFGPSNADSNVTSSLPAQNLTESSVGADNGPLSETNIKIGQHGEATVTITDTRFVPIFSEHPEGVIINILRAIQLSTPNLPGGSSFLKKNELGNSLTEQQINILLLAESLLPELARPGFVKRMTSCTRERIFLDCMRDIAWPTLGQFFPRLPSFPNFGSLQNLARSKISSSASNGSSMDDAASSLGAAETKIELILQEVLSKESRSRLDRSYLNVNDPAVAALLTGRQANIVQLAESGIPDSERLSYVKRILDCVGSSSFISCTQRVSWPTLKQYLPTLPDLSDLQLPQLPDLVGQIQLPALPGTLADIPGLPQLPSLPQLPGIAQLPGISQLGQNVKGIQVDNHETHTAGQPGGVEISGQEQETNIAAESKSAITPSVGEGNSVPGYPGQPTEILVDISKEKIILSEENRAPPIDQLSKLETPSQKKDRKRRDVVDLLNSYSSNDGARETIPFTNVTDSQLLGLLVNMSSSRNPLMIDSSSDVKKEYLVDSLNSTTRDSLTADQYEILKIAEDLTPEQSSRGFVQQVVQCIRSLSFIRCVGIFVWPVISSNLPSLPSFSPFGRSLETNVNEYFGMSTSEFEAELLARKASVEKVLVGWYSALAEKEFQKDLGILRIKGHGNGELSIGFAGSREGRAKIKDNKNLPSILTIISDIMEEVLDQRPDTDKNKRDKEKRERSLNDVHEENYNIAQEGGEDEQQERSINDDKIISMFLEKIKSNVTSYADGQVQQHLNLDDAYNAFEVLFGTRLNNKFAEKLRTLSENRGRPTKEVKIVSLESQSEDSEDPKVIPLDSHVSYDLLKETSDEQEERNRQDRTKNTFAKLLDDYSDRYLQETRVENDDEGLTSSKKITKKFSKTVTKKQSDLTVQLPLLNDVIFSRKTTTALVQLGKGVKNKMSQMMPGIGFAVSFLLQVALAHARAAASVAGFLSNMAMATAMVGMVRDMMFGSNDQAKVKYVYDNDSMNPGVTWPQNPDGWYSG